MQGLCSIVPPTNTTIGENDEQIGPKTYVSCSTFASPFLSPYHPWEPVITEKITSNTLNETCNTSTICRRLSTHDTYYFDIH